MTKSKSDSANLLRYSGILSKNKKFLDELEKTSKEVRKKAKARDFSNCFKI